MTTRLKLETKGFSEYLERVAQAGKDLDTAADQALAAGGEILLAGMQRRVPKDTHNLEGNLEMTEPQRDGNFHVIEVGLSKKADAETARYGNVQEYGSSSMAAQPYVRPALDEDMGKARVAMRQILKKAIGNSE